MADTVYISNGPTLDGAVKVSGNGPGQASSSQTTSLSGPGASGQSQLEDVTVGSMPVVNTLTVETNQDGTIGIKTSVADAMPETGPGASGRNGSTSASTGSVSSVGVQTGWVQVGDGYKYYKEDGSGYKTGWHYEYNADGSKIWYYLDEAPDNKEWMVTGWKKIVRGDGVLSWYHFRVDGKMSRYWECLDGWWYYFEPRDDAGYMVSDWYILNNEYYYFNTDADKGYMQIDWLEIRGKWYYFHKTDEKRGMMAHDFLLRHTDGNLYYLQEKSDGSMAVNKEIKDPATGIVYDANEDGVCTIAIAEVYVTAAQLVAMGWKSVTDSMVSDLNRVLDKYEINTVERIRHFLSQTQHESGNGTILIEKYNGNSPEAYFSNRDFRPEYEHNQAGAGAKYRGAGYIQLTWKSTYRSFGQYIGDGRIVEEGTSYVASNYAWESAGWFWKYYKKLNEKVDSGYNVTQVTKVVNGGSNGLAERKRFYNKAVEIIK